ncbi:hypothetical protein KCU83_g250, partial [Aureobasidium melanogenum]
MDECFKPKRLITRCNALYLSDKKVDEHRSYAINVAPRRTEYENEVEEEEGEMEKVQCAPDGVWQSLTRSFLQTICMCFGGVVHVEEGA